MASSAHIVSLVCPICDEQEVLPRFHRETVASMESTKFPWELVYVDDGSRDQSLSILLELKTADQRVRVV